MSRSTRKPNQPRQLLPASFCEPVHGEAAPKPRHEKSRNGCVTCKARRRKCDEGKPSCSECVRRRVICGGYSRDLRWKEFEKPGQASASIRKNARATHNKPNQASRTSNDAQFGESNAYTTPKTRDYCTSYPSTPNPVVETPFNLSFSPSEQLVDLDTFLSDIGGVDTPICSFTPQQFSQGAAEGDGATELPSFLNLQPSDFNTSDAQPGSATQPSTTAYGNAQRTSPRPNDIGRDNQTGTLRLDARTSSPTQIDRQGMFPFYQQVHIHSDSPETIALVYDRRICEVLCIKEDPTGNPWRRIVWPLAKEHAALYHAIAAMTCFQGANCLPQFREKGIRHLVTSIQKLSAADDNSMRLEVTLAATLALGFAQTWYYPRSSTGISHINSAKSFIQKALSMHLVSQRPAGDLACLNFLANTWIYMDVITRFTCQNVQSLDLEFITACGLFHPVPDSRLQVDPLMGCAGTLFPLIGRVADLVSRVRKDRQKPNSPAIVSRAVELQISIENWTPHVISDEVSTGDSLVSDASDLTQTANAYKWATLLLLYQAVPELPIQLSFSSMAQRVLVLLATIPVGSRVSIFHVLPLMIAGCETTEQEDRDWVRDRWQALSNGNSSGIVDRCLELTSEVWRRRDRYRKRCESCSSSRAETAASLLPSTMAGATRGNHVEDACQCTLSDREVMESPLFPNPTPFAQNQDLRTGARYMGYTVKSKLHWLSIMKEWDWEVMLG